jgi:hypothetical protein
MLGGQDDGVDAHGLVAVVLDGDLRLAVRPQIVDRSRAPELGEAADQLVRQHDRQRHELGRLAIRIAEHQALIARATGVDTLSDVARLLVNRRQHRAGISVVAVLASRVADVADDVTHDLLIVHRSGGRDLAGDDGQPRGDQRLACDPCERVLHEDGIEDAIRDLVGNLVGMPLGYGFGSEEMAADTPHE